jgi:hypothetical protein
VSVGGDTPLGLPVRLALDRRVVTQTFIVRAIAATIALIGSLWLMAARGGTWLSIAGLLTGAFALVWLARGLREQRRALQAGHDVLLDANGITLGPSERQTHLGWDNVASITVDEDRLMVAIQPTTGPTLWLEPHYGGLGVYDLRAVITRVFHQCRPDAAGATPIERG